MNSLSSFFQTEFNTQREQWEKVLAAELKLVDVQSKTVKKSLDLGSWPTLSTQREALHHLPATETWKKAAQTYVSPPSEANLLDDLKAGVKVFFFEKDFLTPELWKKAEVILSKSSKASELEIFLLGRKTFPVTTQFKVTDENEMVTGRAAHDLGGSNVQELALMTTALIESLEQRTTPFQAAVFLDSQFFKNMAKVRAAKLLIQKVLVESKSKLTFKVTGLTSMREWTLYERYSNLLRNDASVASGYIAGADFVQSSGYQCLLEMVTATPSDDHSERSLRMARNTCHILALESMLGVVQDAAYGSFHLENLTEHYASEAWKLMQKLLTVSDKQAFLTNETTTIRNQRLEMVRTRKHILSGMNDFPDKNERLNLKQAPKIKFFRVASEFEDLRLKMEKAIHPPKVRIALMGDYASLNPRINFVKNYFELLGLEVVDPGHSVTLNEFHAQKFSEEIVVFCASDEDYLKLNTSNIQAEKFIAGKFEMAGAKNLFAGQDVVSILKHVADKWGKV